VSGQSRIFGLNELGGVVGGSVTDNHFTGELAGELRRRRCASNEAT
jgi:hypothetical protein